MGYPVHPPLDGTFARPALRPDPRLGGRPMGTAAAWAKTSAESWGLCRQMMVLWKYPLVNKHNYGKSQFSMGKWMLFFHSYVKLPEGNILNNGEIHLINWELYIYICIYNPFRSWTPKRNHVHISGAMESKCLIMGMTFFWQLEIGRMLVWFGTRCIFLEEVVGCWLVTKDWVSSFEG